MAGVTYLLFVYISSTGANGVPFQRAVAHSIGFGPTPTAEQSEATFSKFLCSLFLRF